MIRPEVEDFIQVVRTLPQPVPWDHLWLGGAERLYDHLAKCFPGWDPCQVAMRLDWNELMLYAIAAEITYKHFTSKEEHA